MVWTQLEMDEKGDGLMGVFEIEDGDVINRVRDLSQRRVEVDVWAMIQMQRRRGGGLAFVFHDTRDD
jgi:hypothetical protein